MPGMRTLLAATLGAFSVATSIGAVEMTLDPRAINEAIRMGQSSIDRERARAHEPYRLQVARPPIDWIDVITPFHRVMLAAEARARAGNRLFAQREAFAALQEAPGQITLVIELTFHPLNTFVGVPGYEISLIGAGGKVQPLSLARYPRSQARLATATPEVPNAGGVPLFGKGDPVVGGTIVAPFNGTALNPVGSYAVVIVEAGKELARVPLDLARLR
jgi:hypothetical protein